MSFISPEFPLLCLIFFPLYWLLAYHPKYQRWFLTMSSFGLYASWSLDFAYTLCLYCVAIWGLGHWIANGNHKRRALTIGLVLSSSFLIGVKYYEFIRESLASALLLLQMKSMLPVVDFIAPVGISFFTFQAITYLVSASIHPQKVRTLDQVMLFLSFWPTLFAGPILRAEHFFAQVDAKQTGLPRNIGTALYFIMLGVAQKLVFASWLSETFVDPVFTYPENYSGLVLSASILAFTLQIFLDFAGYTLIVSGLALLLGYDLPANFRQPYLARNLRDFWTRWHISLSTFIRDYIYIPLGGNRRGYSRAQFNLLFSMLISGLWHGPHFTFVIWGLLHGIGVIIVNTYRQVGFKPCPSWLSHTLTLLFIAMTWVFFRATSIESAYVILTGIFINARGFWDPMGLPITPLLLFTLIFCWLSMNTQQLQQYAQTVCARLGAFPTAVFSCLLLSVFISLGPDGIPGFIYYRF